MAELQQMVAMDKFSPSVSAPPPPQRSRVSSSALVEGNMVEISLQRNPMIGPWLGGFFWCGELPTWVMCQREEMARWSTCHGEGNHCWKAVATLFQ